MCKRGLQCSATEYEGTIPRMKKTTSTSLLLIVLAMSACTTQRPVLYPNGKLRAVGEAAAQADIDDCIALAHASGVDDGRAERLASKTAKNATVGAGTGAVVGAISDRRSVGEGAAIGAGATASATLLRGMVNASEPEPIHKRFVSICLQDRGYQLIGWQ